MIPFRVYVLLDSQGFVDSERYRTFPNCHVLCLRSARLKIIAFVISVARFPYADRWFPEVQNIFYQGNKKKLVPNNQDLEKLESFFNCAATLMTDNLQQLCLDSLKDYNDLLVQPQVSLVWSELVHA